MPNPVRKVYAKTRMFVKSHKVAITAVTTAAITARVMYQLDVRASNEMIAFIKEHDLLDQWVVTHPVIVK